MVFIDMLSDTYIIGWGTAVMTNNHLFCANPLTQPMLMTWYLTPKEDRKRHLMKIKTKKYIKKHLLCNGIYILCGRHARFFFFFFFFFGGVVFFIYV